MNKTIRQSVSVLARVLAAITGNPMGQRLLQYNVLASQYLQGIGAGASPDLSGETSLVGRLGKSLTIFDVGANHGQYLTSLHRQLGGRQTNVHAFEPSRAAFESLKAAWGNHPNITLNNIALARESGERVLYSDSPGSGLASLTHRNLQHVGIDHSLEERVRVTTLDEYCRAQNIGRIDLLKIDVEGHELDVLNGGQELFSRKAIAAVTFEFGGCNVSTRTYFHDFYRFFEERGLALYRITPSGYLFPIKAYGEPHEQFGITNFVAMQSIAE